MAVERLDSQLKEETIAHFRLAQDSYADKRWHDPLLINTLSESIYQNLSSDSRVLEVGGGSGYILRTIAEATKAKCVINCELSADVYNSQVDSKIQLVKGTALGLPFTDKCFDFVLSVDLLHHLVGKSMRNSRRNQLAALAEMSRVASDNGLILIYETCYGSELSNFLVFYASLCASKLGIDVSWLYLQKQAIVCFLTRNQIVDMVNNQGILQCLGVFHRKNALKKPLARFMSTMLRANPGTAIVISRKAR